VALETTTMPHKMLAQMLLEGAHLRYEFHGSESFLFCLITNFERISGVLVLYQFMFFSENG